MKNKEHNASSLNATALILKATQKAIPLAFWGLLWVGCVPQNIDPLIGQKSADERVSIMAFNVENLFDTIHDEGTNDYNYLPLEEKQTESHKQFCQSIKHYKYRSECLNLDWNNSILETKLVRVADTILQVNNGRGPDILLLEEVENERVLRQLRDDYLGSAQYRTMILIEGFDKRGIDVAILSRLETITPPKLHKIPYQGINSKDQSKMERSRGILEATLQLPDNTPLTAFAVHFPSPSNPTYWRKQAIEHLNALQKSLPPDHLVIAGGDFNITAQEEREEKMYSKLLSEDWLVAQHIGCYTCKGTNYYIRKKEWSFLDSLLFLPSMHPTKGDPNTKWYVDPDSIRTPNASPHQTSRWRTPERFNIKKGIGVSDHWPVYSELRRRPQR